VPRRRNRREPSLISIPRKTGLISIPEAAERPECQATSKMEVQWHGKKMEVRWRGEPDRRSVAEAILLLATRNIRTTTLH
jgi:hypothetical protein